MEFDKEKNRKFTINGISVTEEDKNKIITAIPKVVKIITKAFLSISVIFAITAFVCFALHYKNSSSEYEIIEGTIIDFEERRSSSGTGSRRHRSSSRTYAPVFTFEYNGQTLTNTHSVTSSSYGGKKSKYQIGSTVELRMYEGNPRKTSINDGFADKICLMIGAIFGFMAIIFFVVSRVVKKVISKIINLNINKDESQENIISF